MKKVRLLMVGCGGQANRVHYTSLALMEDVEIVAVCDLNEEAMNTTAKKYSINKTYVNYREMLDNEEADGIFIIMPPQMMFDIVIDSLRRKLHVFVEKPPGITTTQTETFARESEENGVFGMVGLNRRFLPMINYAKTMVEEKGGVTQVSATFYKNKSAIFYRGGMEALGADGIHCVDTLRYVAGLDQEVEELYSIPVRQNNNVDVAWNAIMRFSNGVTGILHTNYNVGGRNHSFEIHGNGISAYLNPDETARIFIDNEGYHNKNVIVKDTKEIAEHNDVLYYYGTFQQDRHFIDCIKNNVMPLTNFHDAIKTMKLVDRIKTNS
jgi:predicted dehydrogenase